MKTERRHELQNNDLVALAEKYAGDVMPHAKKIVGIAIVVAVALLAMMLMRSRGKTAAKQGWTSYFAAVSQSDLDGLNDVAQDYPRSSAGAWALQSSGDINLATGTVNMFSDREEAMERFATAKDNFTKAKQYASDDLLRQRSMMGLAQTHEALGEFDEAKSLYDEVERMWPDTSVTKLANERRSVISHPETKEFYDWFVAQEVQPPANPLGDMQVKPPSIYDDLPSDPNLTVPTADELGASRDRIQPPEGSVDDSPVPDVPTTGDLNGDAGGDFKPSGDGGESSDAGTDATESDAASADATDEAASAEVMDSVEPAASGTVLQSEASALLDSSSSTPVPVESAPVAAGAE